MLNYRDTIVSQYQNSPTLMRLIANINAYLDPSADLDAFYKLIWNVSTAQGYGLDVWGRIVGVTRVLNIQSSPYFGYEEASGALITGYNQAPFYTGVAATSNYALGDASFLQLIYAKAYANITDGSIGSINNILMVLFGSTGICYCTDGENMTMTYTFSSVLSPVNLAIVQQSGVLPRPPGVALTIVQ